MSSSETGVAQGGSGSGWTGAWDPAAPGGGSTGEVPEADAEGKVFWAGAEEGAGTCCQRRSAALAAISATSRP